MNTLDEIDVADEAVLAINTYFKADKWSVTASALGADGWRHGLLKIGEWELPFCCRPDVTSKRLLNVAKGSTLPEETVFLIPFVNPEDREKCRELGINFLDAAGNCCIVSGGLHWIIDAHTSAPERPLSLGRGFKYNGLKLIYACYEQPELLLGNYRTMAKVTGLSLGTISGIIEDLRKDGFLGTRKDGSHAFNHGRELFQRWAYAYLDEVQPRTFRRQLLAVDDDILDRIDALKPEDGVFLGGERAAMVRSGYLRSPNFTLHTNVRLGDLVLKYRLAPFNRRPQRAVVVDLYSVFHPSPRQYTAKQHRATPIIGDLIVLAELLKTHESRQLEAADELLNHEIQDRFTALGLQW